MSNESINLSIQDNKGISHAILKRLQDVEKVVAQGKNLSGSVWGQIMDLVEKDNKNNKHYTKGSDFQVSPSDSEHWHKNFVVQKGATITFAKNLWNQIVALAKGEKPQNIPDDDQNDIPDDDQNDIPDDDQNDIPDDDQNDIPDDDQNDIPDDDQNDIPDDDQNDIPDDDQNDLPDTKPYGPTSREVPDGAKQQLRDIVNIDSKTKGNKETVIKSKNEDGETVYNQAVVDPNDGTVKMGSELAVDRRGLKKNEYYAKDSSIPAGAEIDRKTVDGKKDVLNYEVKDENGVKHRYLMIQDPKTKKYSKGDEIFVQEGGLGIKNNKFISESKLNEQIAKLGVGTIAELREKGITVQPKANGGVEFIKDGKKISTSEIKGQEKIENKEPDNKKIDDGDKDPFKSSRDVKIEITSEIRERIKNVPLDSVDADLNYRFDENGRLEIDNTNVSLIKDIQADGKQSIIEMVQKIPTRRLRNGQYTKFGLSHINKAFLNNRVKSKVEDLSKYHKVYQDLSAKPAEELSQAEKNFMARHEQNMARLFQEYDAAVNGKSEKDPAPKIDEDKGTKQRVKNNRLSDEQNEAIWNIVDNYSQYGNVIEKNRMVDGKKQHCVRYWDENKNEIREVIYEDGTKEAIVEISDKINKRFVTAAKLQDAIGTTTIPNGVKCECSLDGTLTFKDAKSNKNLTKNEVLEISRNNIEFLSKKEKNKAADAAKKLGLQETWGKDYGCYKATDGTHYLWDSKKDKFVERKDISTAFWDELYFYKDDSEMLKAEKHAQDEIQKAKQEAEKLGLRETHGSDYGWYYNDKEKKHYYWNSEQQKFEYRAVGMIDSDGIPVREKFNTVYIKK